MNGLKSVQDVLRNRERVGDLYSGRKPLVDEVVEIRSLDELHDDIEGVTVLAGVEDLDDVWMADLSGEPSLPRELLDDGQFVCQMLVEPLDGDRAVIVKVYGAEDAREAAFPDERAKLIPTGEHSRVGDQRISVSARLNASPNPTTAAGDPIPRCVSCNEFARVIPRTPSRILGDLQPSVNSLNNAPGERSVPAHPNARHRRPRCPRRASVGSTSEGPHALPGGRGPYRARDQATLPWSRSAHG